jgi:hypothetical protein
MKEGRKTTIKRSIGTLFLVIAVAVAWVDLYWLAPARKLADSRWLQEHSEHAHWIELQKLLTRRSPYIPHEAFTVMGRWGDKANVAWFMAEFRAGRDYGECSEGHLSAALPEITNQGYDFDSVAWLGWWTTNQHKSQLEWIQDGFRQQGILVEAPLTSDNKTDLLKLLGQPAPSHGPISTNRVRPHLKFNAFRWLRDAGFTTPQIATNLSGYGINDRESLTAGLLKYATFWGVYADNSLKLPITGQIEAAPVYETSWRTWITYLIVVTLTISGMGLWRKRSNKPTTSAPSS